MFKIAIKTKDLQLDVAEDCFLDGFVSSSLQFDILVINIELRSSPGVAERILCSGRNCMKIITSFISMSKGPMCIVG